MSSCPPPPDTLPSGIEPRSTLPTEPDRRIADTGTAEQVYGDIEPTVLATPPVYPPDPYRGRVVAKLHTPVTEVELYTLARTGHLLAFGVTASYEAGLVAWAHLCDEHARGSAVYNHCFGNQAATHEWTGPVAWLSAPEREADGSYKTHAQPLRAYTSPEQGAAGYWTRLHEGYPSALATFDAGDGDRAARALKAARYFTEDVEVVARGMRLLVAEARRRFAPGVP